MQELTAPTQTASPYTPAGGSNMAAAPRLGTPIPGTTASMPAQSGLSVFNTPLAPSLQSTPQQTAQQMRGYGRGDDSMLIHMTPDEVGGLQNLAMAHGGSLTINPDTGLPEAGWLGKLLPTLIGAALAATGVGAPLAAGIVGIGQTALTGDINKGLMAGLQAFGGGSLAGAAGLGGAISSNAGGILGSNAGIFGANMGAGAAAAGAGAAGAAGAAAPMSAIPGAAPAAAAPMSAIPSLASSATPASVLGGGASGPMSLIPQAGATAAKTGLAGFGQGFGKAASAGLGGSAAKYAPYLAGYGVFSGLSEASQPPAFKPEESKSKYEGPYSFPTRRFDPRESGPGGEIQFFDEVNPLGVLTSTGQRRYAEGGEAKDEENPKFSYTGEIEDARKNYLKEFDSNVAKLNPSTLDAATQAGIKSQRDWLTNPIAGSDTGLARASIDQINTVGSSYINSLKSLAERPGAGITSTPAPIIGNIDPKMGGVTPGTGTDATTTAPGGGLTSTTVGPIGDITPTMGGVTPGTGTGATLSDRILSPGATQSGAGLEALKDTYTPSFSSAADFTTAAAPPSTMGADLFSALGDLSSRYGGSPGAITASSGYAGGSPSERIREMARANAAARAAAAATAATTPPVAGGAVNPVLGKPGFIDGTGEVDYGTNAPTPFTGGAFNPFAGGTFNPFSGGMINPPAGGTVNPYAGGAVNPALGPAASGSNIPLLGEGTGEIDYGMAPPTGPGMINPFAIGTQGFYDQLLGQYGNFGGGYSGEASEAGGGGYGGGGGGYSRGENVDYKAKGGVVNMDNGAFVVDARTVSEMGNGSSNAGIERLAAMGGRPVRGAGDGVSDSVRARIGGRQEARVARDEVIFSPQVIARLGNGSHSKGTQKLYALMKKAHTARKHAKRGQDTKMAKGLGAIA